MTKDFIKNYENFNKAKNRVINELSEENIQDYIIVGYHILEWLRTNKPTATTKELCTIQKSFTEMTKNNIIKKKYPFLHKHITVLKSSFDAYLVDDINFFGLVE